MKKIMSIAAGLLLAAGSVAVSAPTASAASVDCDTWKSSTAPYKGYAKCTGMLPYPLEGVQVRVTCIDARGSQWHVNGSRVGNGKTSTAKCSDNPSVGIYKVGLTRSRM
ncbi:hypothetical protein [Streptomyces sp. SID14515]|uniref:hypothetical protein n=1 Tax=Streptomyces sp. SID14515 TaxID=2706074 RepID=UPI0013C717C6|nr:hypothetical protein [Streptomyces sp. SID14515]NEB39843.1 hypothetical protein [Streptomyces sp. SID14515]